MTDFYQTTRPVGFGAIEKEKGNGNFWGHCVIGVIAAAPLARAPLLERRTCRKVHTMSARFRSFLRFRRSAWMVDWAFDAAEITSKDAIAIAVGREGGREGGRDDLALL